MQWQWQTCGIVGSGAPPLDTDILPSIQIVASMKHTQPCIFWVTLLVGIEMSFFGIKIFRSSFGIEFLLTSTVQDVGAKTTRTGWSQEEDDLNAEQQSAESRCQKRSRYQKGLAICAYASWLLSPNRIIRNHAESCDIMADHAIMPLILRESAWLCLKVGKIECGVFGRGVFKYQICPQNRRCNRKRSVAFK